MEFKFKKEIFFAAIFVVTSGCSSYQEGMRDVSGDEFIEDKFDTQCLHMTQAQVAKCKADKTKLVLIDPNCNTNHQYLRAQCEKDKAAQKKLLDNLIKKQAENKMK